MVRRSLIAVTRGVDEAEHFLEEMSEGGRILSWEPQPMGRVAACEGASGNMAPLTACFLGRDADEGQRARDFWRGAIEQDGSMSDELLAIMRMDDEKRRRYKKQYASVDRYVTEQECLHADAFLGPDGEWADSSHLRGRNQLHEWVTGFVDRHISPLMGGDEEDALLISTYTYLEMP